MNPEHLDDTIIQSFPPVNYGHDLENICLSVNLDISRYTQLYLYLYS